MHLIFFSSDFYIFFLCICVCNTKGDAHKPCGPPKREGKPILPRVWKDLAHCVRLAKYIQRDIRNESFKFPAVLFLLLSLCRGVRRLPARVGFSFGGKQQKKRALLASTLPAKYYDVIGSRHPNLPRKTRTLA